MSVQKQAEPSQAAPSPAAPSPAAPSALEHQRSAPLSPTFQRPETALAFTGVAFTYQGRRPTTALSDFTLGVGVGERVAIVGPSGCGKSTLLALAAGLIEPTSGGLEAAQAVALMPQRDLLVPWRSALGNAALALEAQGVPRRRARELARPLFERFGLESFENSRTWELSGGMRQRVAFLRTILTGRPLLALDEPFGALDSITRGEMQEWLHDALIEEPRTLLLVTHDIDEALTLADRIVVMTGRPGTVAAEIALGRPPETTRGEWVTSRRFADAKARALEALA